MPKPDRATLSILGRCSSRRWTERSDSGQIKLLRCGPSVRRSQVETISRSTVRLRRLSIVTSERSAKSLPTLDATVGPAGFPRWRDEFVIETLVIPLQMIMGDESANTRAEVIFSQRYHAAEALAFDRSNKTFGVGVQIRGQLSLGTSLFNSSSQLRITTSSMVSGNSSSWTIRNLLPSGETS